MKTFLQGYINRLQQLLDAVDISTIEAIIEALETTLKLQGKIYIIGNGGSAATASHMVNDLGVGLRRRDIINFDIISLADNTPVTTAIANDLGYENIFYAQLKDQIKSEDVLIAISCSGNSQNITKAAQYACDQGATIIGLTGFDGGELKRLATHSFHIQTPASEYGLVEDMHMILDHMIYSYYINKKSLDV